MPKAGAYYGFYKCEYAAGKDGWPKLRGLANTDPYITAGLDSFTNPVEFSFFYVLKYILVFVFRESKLCK